jgi:anti-sigma factor RsiW
MKKRTKPEDGASRLCTLECEEFVWLLTEYWENQEDLELRVEVEEHARACPECRRVFAEYAQTVRVCRSAPRVATPEEVHRRFWDQLTREIRALREYLE